MTDDLDRANWDPGVVALCDAINAVPGLRTTSSCEGHGEHPLRVWLEADSVRALFPLARACSRNYYGCRLRCLAQITDLPATPVIFLVESLDVGPAALAEADRCAAAVLEVLTHPGVRKRGFLWARPVGRHAEDCEARYHDPEDEMCDCGAEAEA